MSAATRIERDAFGEVEVPADRYWGAQTQRALAVFDIGAERFPACLIHATALQNSLPPGPIGVLECSRRSLRPP